jgi:RimJ/RimL family protein N-acetyltransferase
VARGDRCYGGFVDGRLAHYTWLQTSGRHHIAFAGRTLAVQPGEPWIYHARTAEWARRRGLLSAVLRAILADCRRQGSVRAWCYAVSENFASQRVFLGAGCVFDRSLRSLRFGRVFIPVP